MFPVTVTLHNADQLRAVMSALGTPETTTTKAETEKKSENKPAASTASASTQTTAAASAAPAAKANDSANNAVMSVEDRANTIKGLAANGKRDAVVARLAKYGAKKGSEVKDADLPAFDAELKAL